MTRTKAIRVVLTTREHERMLQLAAGEEESAAALIRRLLKKEYERREEALSRCNDRGPNGMRCELRRGHTGVHNGRTPEARAAGIELIRQEEPK